LEKVAAELPNDPEVFVCDLSVAGAASRLLDMVSERTGVPDILVNNAALGGESPSGPLNDEDLTDLVQVNLTSALVLAVRTASAMAARAAGAS
jgi:short-subunit dehydrogenase